MIELCVLLAATTTPTLAQQATSLAAVSSVVFPPGRRVEDALTIDIDGDGVSDLVVATSHGGGRTLSVHLRRAQGAAFASLPEASLELTPDVVCFAAADVHGDLGREIVLFNSGGAFAWRWRAADEGERIQKLFNCDLVWQWPDRKRAFAWQAAVSDLDGDGLDDLAVPEPQRYRLAFQRRGEGGARAFVAIQELAPGDAQSNARALDLERTAEVRQSGAPRRTNFSVTGGGFQVDAGEGTTGPYLWIQDSVPCAQFVDFDGDGLRDALFLTNDALEVFVQKPAGTFAASALRLKSPVTMDRARELDVSYLADALDLDDDRRVDVVMSAGDKRSKDVRTQVLVFLAGKVKAGESPLFGRDGIPTQLLVLDGFARPLGLDDVDGDGRTDLVMGAVRPDLIDGLRAAASERIDAELYVFKNTGTGFSKRPDLVHKISIQAGDLDLTARFLGDVTGDGVAELFQRADRNALRVHLVRRTKDGLSVIDKPIYEMPLDNDARLMLPKHLGPGSWDIFALEKEAVRCASFR
ncbi:MAG: FG-GAP repeat protein [Planctomycetes bacterium]|nr:FG-GAP repeat protein [Planctomycetota bacterium]